MILIKIDILFYEHHVLSHLNFGVSSIMNKEMVTFIQLHTYKFGLVYKEKSATVKLGLKMNQEDLVSTNHNRKFGVFL